MEKYIPERFFSSIFLTLFLLVVMTGNAFAHKVTVFAWVEGDMVYTESKFSGGRKAKNAPIEVYDGKGNKILEGVTNEEGKFSFKAPHKTEMKIVLVAGMGHKGEWTIPIEEFGVEAEEGAAPSDSNEAAVTEPVAAKEIDSRSEQQIASSTCPDSKEIQQAMEKALDKKLKPVINKLNQSLDPDKGPSLSDILGGIGYIFGLVGIAAYFNYRNKKKGGL